MKIAVRVDASLQIGTGHFMRCLTLADALKQRGAQIRFVSRYLPEHMRGMLATKGYEFTSLDGAPNGAASYELTHARLLGVNQEQDASDSIQALTDGTWDWLIVDHYALDFRWESVLRQSSKKILVIDDIADRQHDCDVLLDQNYYADMDKRYAGKIPAHCRLLLGPRYALLRDEFWELREQVKPRSGIVKRLLVFFGGVDADNYTSLAIKALAELEVKGLQVDVVIGAQHPHRTEIEVACAEHEYVCHVQTNRMGELMAAADLAIGAGGSSNWERCVVGLPSLVMVLAENQDKAVKDLASAGVLINLGDARLIMKSDLIRAIKKLLIDERLRTELSNASLQLVPMSKQNETAEIMNIMFNYDKFSIRRIEIKDKDQILQWRNSDRVRWNMYNYHVISQKEHDAWFSRALVDTSAAYLVFLYEARPIGFASFTNISVIHGRCHWAFYLGELDVPRGCGSVMEFFALDYAFITLKIRKLCCEVFTFNDGVIKLHEKFGFVQEGRFVEHYKKNEGYEDIVCLAKFASSWADERPAFEKRLFGN